MNDIELVDDTNDDDEDGQDTDDEEMAINTFSPLRDDSIARFTGHQGITNVQYHF